MFLNYNFWFVKISLLKWLVYHSSSKVSTIPTIRLFFSILLPQILYCAAHFYHLGNPPQIIFLYLHSGQLHVGIYSREKGVCCVNLKKYLWTLLTLTNIFGYFFKGLSYQNFLTPCSVSQRGVEFFKFENLCENELLLKTNLACLSGAQMGLIHEKIEVENLVKLPL